MFTSCPRTRGDVDLWRSPCLKEHVRCRPAFSVPRARLLAVFVPLLALVAHSAHAQESGDRRARALFDEAGELERRGNWAAAEDRLRAALRIRETPHLRYALGWALQNAGKLIAARTEYEVALRLAQHSRAEEVSELASARITEVGRMTPLLQVRILGRVSPETRVSIDDRDAPISGDSATLAVDPGTHVVRVTREGVVRSDQSVTVAAGALRVVDVKDGDGRIVLGGGSPRAEGEGAVLPWILLGGGTALVGGGALLVVASMADLDARDENVQRWCAETACVDGTKRTLPETSAAAAYRQEAYDAASRGNTKQIIGAVVGGIGVVGMGVGLYMFVKKGPRREEPRTGTFRVDASPLAGGGMMSGALTF